MQGLRPAVSHLKDLLPYDPRYLPARVYLNANESPYGLPDNILAEMAGSLTQLNPHRYPDPLAKSLRTKIAELYTLQENNVLLGNGGDELIFNILLAYGGSSRKLLIAPPSFSSYEIDARLTRTELIEIPRPKPWDRLLKDSYTGTENLEYAIYGIDEKAIINRVSRGDIDVVMLASPNNPTGEALSEGFIISLLQASDAVVLIDQAYVEFADPQYDMRLLLAEYANLAILRTFSKAYALAGLRLGYLLAAEELVKELCKVRQPYSINSFSAHAGLLVMENIEDFASQITESKTERRRVAEILKNIQGITVFESQANFLLIQVNDAHQIWKRLYEEKGILLRDFSSAQGLDNCLRMSMGTPQENDSCIDSLLKALREQT